MVSSDTAAPSARSFTTTTSPGMTRIRKNTAMATPTRVGITKIKRRSRYQNMGSRQQDAGGVSMRRRLAPVTIDPAKPWKDPATDSGWGHIPAVDLLVD